MLYKAPSYFLYSDSVLHFEEVMLCQMAVGTHCIGNLKNSISVNDENLASGNQTFSRIGNEGLDTAAEKGKQIGKANALAARGTSAAETPECRNPAEDSSKHPKIASSTSASGKPQKAHDFLIRQV